MSWRVLVPVVVLVLAALAPGCNCGGAGTSGDCTRRCGGDSGASTCAATERCVSGCCVCIREPEVCDGMDQDCDLRIDDGLEATCACAPGGPGRSDEVCNGIDDDCDGEIDDDVPSPPEVCDGMDQDCDGVIDEDVPTDPETCNAVDDDCSGEVDDGLDPAACPCAPGGAGMSDEVCNGVDDDCDGTIDDGLDPLLCPCAPGGAGPGPEDCDGVDDDCDGTIDDGLDPLACACAPGGPGQGPEACNASDDDCNGIVDDDTMLCGGTSACACAPGGPGASAETCNAVDDDCDGVVDDGVAGCACTACGAAGAETCNTLDDDCDGVADDGLDPALCACAPGGPGMRMEICNRADDDCDGVVDERSATGGACAGFGDRCTANGDCSSQLCTGDAFDRYCTETCLMPGMRPGDCPGGYRCWDNVSVGGSDLCRRNYAACARNADCAAGEVCVPTCNDAGNDTITECRPALGALAAPAACTRDAECRSGECLRTGICSDLCASDADCASGHRCVLQTYGACGGTDYIGRCLDACDCDTECPAGQLCQPFAHAVLSPAPTTVVGACDTSYGPLGPGEDCDNSMGMFCAHAICSRGGTGFCTQVCSATCGCPAGIGPCGPSTVTFGGLGSFPGMTCGTM